MKKRIINLIKQILFLSLSAVVIMPFYLVVINSFKERNEAARMSLALPKKWLFENYLVVIEQGKLIQGFTNSMIYAVISTVLGVMICAMAAYVLCRRKTKLNTFLYYFFLCGLFVPVSYVTLIRVLNAFSLNNSRLGIIVVFTSSMIPFCVFTIRNFVLTIPVEMDEAAVIDGAGSITLFFKIIFPLLKPIITTCFILQFMGIWSDFLTPLYLSNSSSMHPMTLSVYQFFGKNKSYWNYIFADIILTCLPMIAVYLMGQKYMISGITSGAVKG